MPRSSRNRYSAIRVAAIALFAVTLVGAAGANQSQRDGGFEARVVLASWYGPRFDGRPTASGEPFDQHALTAAHRILPFGTELDVTNLANGRTVTVVVNDRGPYVGKRKLDLSFAAARQLGMIKSGVATVLIEPR